MKCILLLSSIDRLSFIVLCILIHFSCFTESVITTLLSRILGAHFRSSRSKVLLVTGNFFFLPYFTDS